MTLDLSVTLISALGCSGLTDNQLSGKMGIYLICLRLTDNLLSGSCKLLGALSGSDGQNGSIAARSKSSKDTISIHLSEKIPTIRI